MLLPETIPFTGTNLTIPVLMTYERLMALGPRPSIEVWLNVFNPLGELIGSKKETLPVTGIEAENGLCIKFVVDNPDGNSGKILLRP